MVVMAQKPVSLVEDQIWQIASNVPDPEIPVITIGELGIVRAVTLDEEGRATVSLTPTYSGCPAVQVIEENVHTALAEAGINAQVKRVIYPPWTTDWISQSGRKKLTACGIAPPVKSSASKPGLFQREAPHCPRCNSSATVLISQFGSTPCKSHYRCESCLDPFDYFKCL